MDLEKKLKYLSFFPVIKKKNYKNLTKMQQNATIILTKGRSLFFFWCKGVQYEIQNAAGLPRWSGNNKYVQSAQYRHDGVQ